MKSQAHLDLHSPSPEYHSSDNPAAEHRSDEQQVTINYDKRKGKRPEITEEPSTSDVQNPKVDLGQFEDYMHHINDLLKVMRQTVKDNDYKGAIRQCDEIISGSQAKIAEARSLNMGKLQLDQLHRARNFA